MNINKKSPISKKFAILPQILHFYSKTFDGTRTEVNLAKLPHRGALIARVMQNGKILATQSVKVM
jgi:hypothetical protein